MDEDKMQEKEKLEMEDHVKKKYQKAWCSSFNCLILKLCYNVSLHSHKCLVSRQPLGDWGHTSFLRKYHTTCQAY